MQVIHCILILIRQLISSKQRSDKQKNWCSFSFLFIINVHFKKLHFFSEFHIISSKCCFQVPKKKDRQWRGEKGIKYTWHLVQHTKIREKETMLIYQKCQELLLIPSVNLTPSWNETGVMPSTWINLLMSMDMSAGVTTPRFTYGDKMLSVKDWTWKTWYINTNVVHIEWYKSTLISIETKRKYNIKETPKCHLYIYLDKNPWQQFPGEENFAISW